MAQLTVRRELNNPRMGRGAQVLGPDGYAVNHGVSGWYHWAMPLNLYLQHETHVHVQYCGTGISNC